MRTTRCGCIGLLVCLYLSLSTFAQSRYIITDLGTLGGSGSYAYAINNKGQVAGYSYTAMNSTRHAFLYDNGSMKDVGTLGDWSEGYAINDKGYIAGSSSSTSGIRAFLYDGTLMKNLGVLGANPTSSAAAVNNNGFVVGNSSSMAFVYNGNVMKFIGYLGGSLSYATGINDKNQTTGYSDTSLWYSIDHAFLYDGTTMKDLGTLGGTNSWAYGINNNGHIVGYSDIAGDSVRHAFLYDGTQMKDIGILGGISACARAINDKGQVVGYSQIIDGSTECHAFLYDGNNMIDLNTLLPAGSGWIVTYAYGINNSGQIAGEGINPAGNPHAFLMTPFEPAYNLSPDDGAVMLTNLLLDWDCNAVNPSYNLYLSSNFNDVNTRAAAALSAKDITDSNHLADALLLNTTYYWAVDVNCNGIISAGTTISSFTTAKSYLGDINCDGKVQFTDVIHMVALLNNYGQMIDNKQTIAGKSEYYDLLADINRDGMIRFDDIIMAAGWINQYGKLINRKPSIRCPHPYGSLVRVPNTCQMTEALARTSVGSAFLSVGTVTKDYDDNIPTGGVIRSQPVFGSVVKQGTVVNLVVSKGLDPTKIVWVTINDPGISGHEGFNRQMSKYETTNIQYAKYLNDALASGDIYVDGYYVIGANGSNSGKDFPAMRYYQLYGSEWNWDGVSSRISYSNGVFTADSQYKNYPVSYVNWFGATAFADYYGWRLPTAWEWRAVADYDGSYIYGCGTTINKNIANYLYSVHPYKITAVGSFGTFGYGLADMSGNVSEWTSTLVPAASYYYCGGSWNNDDYYCNISRHEVTYGSDMNYGRTGFRVCR